DHSYSSWTSLYSSGDANSKYAQTVGGATPSVYTNNPASDLVNTGAGYLFMDPAEIRGNQFLHISELDLVSVLFVKDNGTPIATVTDDIDAEVRHLSTPTIGADELVACPMPIITLQPDSV